MNGRPAPMMLIGRDDELQLIRDALAEATQRRPQMLVVSGDAGIGKSAVAHEAARLASDRAFTVLSGACLDVSADAAFAPVLEAVRPLLRSAGTTPRLGSGFDSPASDVVARLLPGAASGKLTERRHQAPPAPQEDHRGRRTSRLRTRRRSAAPGHSQATPA